MTRSQRLSVLTTAVGHVHHAQECLDESKDAEAKAALRQAIDSLIRCRASIQPDKLEEFPIG